MKPKFVKQRINEHKEYISMIIKTRKARKRTEEIIDSAIERLFYFQDIHIVYSKYKNASWFKIAAKYAGDDHFVNLIQFAEQGYEINYKIFSGAHPMDPPMVIFDFYKNHECY